MPERRPAGFGRVPEPRPDGPPVLDDSTIAALLPERGARGHKGTFGKLLVLAEDWCVDTSSTLPVLARWVEATPGLSLRILRRDDHPELMDRYLSDGRRSIPVVLVLDRDFNVLRHWGPYSAPLSEWVREHKPPALVKEEFVKGKRTWYARDRGETTLREVMARL